MNTLRLCLFLAIIGIWTVFAVTAQDDRCPAIVETALNAADELCTTIGRNQACYGHVAISAEPLPDAGNFVFQQAGDIIELTSLGRMQLSPMDITSGAWGVAVMRIQANLPDTLPGQNVTMLVFGDTQITNQGTAVTTIAVTTNTGGSSASVRVGPFASAGIIGSLPDQITVRASGRSADNLWLLVDLPDGSGRGWIAAELLQLSGAITSLNIVQPGAPQFGPMQAFYLSTGVGAPVCNEAPNDGILVQTPAGADAVNLVINQVEVTFGSTLYLRATAEGEMTFSLVEGAALVTHGAETRPMVAGGRVRIPVDENLNPAGAPGSFEPYDMAIIAPLPVTHLERPIEAAPPVSPEQAAALNEFAPYFAQLDLSQYADLFALINDPALTSPEQIEQAIFERFGISLAPPEEDLGIIAPPPTSAPIVQPQQDTGVIQPPPAPATEQIIDATPTIEIGLPEVTQPPIDNGQTPPTEELRGDDTTSDQRDPNQRDDQGDDTSSAPPLTFDPGQIQINPDIIIPPVRLIVPTPTLEPLR